MKDTAKHQGLRNQLVSLLQQKGITDKNVLDAISKIPRHLFLNSSFEDYAYQDKAFPIGAGQTISQPYTVAFQSQLLEVKKDDKVLEIGTGSGYQTAVLCAMGAKVYSVERQNELFKKRCLGILLIASNTFLSVIPFCCKRLTNWFRSPWCLAVSFKSKTNYFGKNKLKIQIPNEKENQIKNSYF